MARVKKLDIDRTANVLPWSKRWKIRVQKLDIDQAANVIRKLPVGIDLNGF